MGWGVMGGLGQALTNIGQQWDESNKIALKDKLEADREAAKDAREEARAKREVKDRRLEQLPDGSGYAWREVNRYGDVIRSTPATPDEVQQVQDAAKLRGLDLRIKAAGATTAEVTANDAPDAVTRTKETHDLQLRTGEQGIEASRATVAQGWRRLDIDQQNANTSRRGVEGRLTGDTPSKPVELSDAALALVNKYKDYNTAFPDLTQADFYDAANQALKLGASMNKDFGDVYRRIVTARAAAKK